MRTLVQILILSTLILGAVGQDGVDLLDVDILVPESSTPSTVRVLEDVTYDVQVVLYVSQGGVASTCTAPGCEVSLSFGGAMGVVTTTVVTDVTFVRIPVTFSPAGMYGLNVTATHVASGLPSLAPLSLAKSISVLSIPTASLAFPAQTTVGANTRLDIHVADSAVAGSPTTFHVVSLAPASHLVSLGPEILNERIDAADASFQVVFVSEHVIANAPTLYSLEHTVSSVLGGRNRTVLGPLTVNPRPQGSVVLSPPSGDGSTTTVSTTSLPLAVRLAMDSGSYSLTFSVSLYSAVGSTPGTLLASPAMLGLANVTLTKPLASPWVNGTIPLPSAWFASAGVPVPGPIVAILTLSDALGVASVPAQIVSSPIQVEAPAVYTSDVAPLVSGAVVGAVTTGAPLGLEVTHAPGALGGAPPLELVWGATRLSDGTSFVLDQQTVATKTSTFSATASMAKAWLLSPTTAESFALFVNVTDSAGVRQSMTPPGWAATTVTPGPDPVVQFSSLASPGSGVASQTGSFSVAAAVPTGGSLPFSAATLNLVPFPLVSPPPPPSASWPISVSRTLPAPGSGVALSLPSSVGPGTYALELVVVDALGAEARVTNSSALLTVVAPVVPVLDVSGGLGGPFTEGANVSTVLTLPASGGVPPFTAVFHVSRNAVPLVGSLASQSGLAQGMGHIIEFPLGDSGSSSFVLSSGISPLPVAIGVDVTDASGVTVRALTGTLSVAPPLAVSFAQFAPSSVVSGQATAGGVLPLSLAVSGGNPPYTMGWSADSGAGVLSFAGSGVGVVDNTLTLLASSAGSVVGVSVTVTETGGGSASVLGSLNVVSPADVSGLSVAPGSGGAETLEMTASFTIVNGTGPFSVVVEGVPGAVARVVDAGDGVKSVTFAFPPGSLPAGQTSGVLPVSLRVTDASGVVSVSGSVDVTVYPAPSVVLGVESSPVVVGNGETMEVFVEALSGGDPGSDGWRVRVNAELDGVVYGTSGDVSVLRGEVGSVLPLGVDLSISLPPDVLGTGVDVNITYVVEDTAGASVSGQAPFGARVEPSTGALASGLGPSSSDELSDTWLALIIVGVLLCLLCLLLLILFLVISRRRKRREAPELSVDEDEEGDKVEMSNFSDGSTCAESDAALLATVDLGDLFDDVIAAVHDAEVHVERKGRGGGGLTISSSGMSSGEEYSYSRYEFFSSDTV